MAVLFRYGVVVLNNLEQKEAEGVLDAIRSPVANAFPSLEEESRPIGLDPDREERTDEEGRLWLRTATVERFQVIAEVFIDLIQARQTIRVEWYIVIMIVVEIVIILYELVRKGV